MTAIAPTSAAGHPVKRLVVGVDGSAGSAAAVAFCATLAPLLTATVVAVYADEPLVEWVSGSSARSWRSIISSTSPPRRSSSSSPPPVTSSTPAPASYKTISG